MNTEQIAITALTAFTTTMVSKGADAPARTLNLLWEFIFGKFDAMMQNSISARPYNLTNFGNKIHEFTKDIPPEHIQEPDLAIMGPALEASKYYIEKEPIRNAFAKLIAASFDARKNESTHHSYVEIIKQMNPNDAKIFTKLKNPFYLLCYSFSIESRPYIRQDIYLDDCHQEPSLEDSIAIGNLERLNLIAITRQRGGITTHYPETQEIITHFKQTNLYKTSKEEIILVEQGLLTEYGWNFRQCCL